MNAINLKDHNVVLAAWGAQTPGKRISTKLAVIEVVYETEVQVTFVREFIAPKPEYYQRARKIPRKSVYASWPEWPTNAQLRTAKKSVPLVVGG